MIEWTKPDRTPLYELFDSFELVKTMVKPWIEMGLGHIHVDSLSSPRVSLYKFSILNFVVGESSSHEAKELLQSFPPMNVLFVPDESWAELVKSEWGEKTKVQHRTRMDASSLDLDHLLELKGRLPSGYDLQPITGDILRKADSSMVETLNLVFSSIDEFLEHGFGYCILHESVVVSMAYACFPFIKDFEIQVNTLNSEKYRQKGLATVVSAALIEHGLRNGLTPQWDAANPVSVKLAEKLGYTSPQPYDVFFWLPSS